MTNKTRPGGRAAAGPTNKAPQRIQNIERMLYVKALRLANDEPTEVAEIRALHLQLVQWMTNTEQTPPRSNVLDAIGGTFNT